MSLYLHRAFIFFSLLATFALPAHAGPTTDIRALQRISLSVISSGEDDMPRTPEMETLNDDDRRAILVSAFSGANENGLSTDQRALLLQLRDRFAREVPSELNHPFIISSQIQQTMKSSFIAEYNEAQTHRRNWYPFWLARGHFNAESLWLRGPRVDRTVPPQIAEETDVLPALLELIRRLEIQAGTDSAKWNSLLETAYNLAERELLKLDRDLKLAAQYDPSSADKISALVVATMFSNEDDSQSKIARTLFDRIKTQATLNIRANRYITRAIAGFLNNVASPSRVWMFRAAVVMGLIAGSPMFLHDRWLHNVGFNLVAPYLKFPVILWIDLSILQATKPVSVAFAKVADRALNTVRAALGTDKAMGNAGPLERSCIRFLEEHRKSPSSAS